MVIEINFTPHRLKSLVVELEKRIGKATGEPVRLDLEIYLNQLKKYKENPTEENMPTLISLEKLSTLIPKIKEEQLEGAFFDCLRNKTNSRITSAVLEHYFNNYQDEFAKNYLHGNIQNEILSYEGWKLWSHHRDIFFKGDVKNNIAQLIIREQIPLQSIHERLGMHNPYLIKEDSFSHLCNNKHLFDSYLKHLSLQAILSILSNGHLQRFHTAIWDYALPHYLKEAKAEKRKKSEDHALFSKAKLRLKPSRSPQWLRLSNNAKEAYKEWAFGERLEEFFDKDTDNERILFWKRYIRHMDNIKEITCRGELEAFAISIGRYEFIEFRNIGAIYAYSKGAVKIPNRVSDLSELKFRNKVVHAGTGVDRGEGWVPHQGKMWLKRANKLINEALR